MGCTSSDAHGHGGIFKLKRPAPEEGITHAGPWVKKVSDITGFPVFPEEYKQSLLSKALNKDVWEKCKGKSDAKGVSFETCILSGVQNVDSGIGCYAGSHDSYTTFAPLFDQVIEMYHKHGKDGKHISNMNASELNCPEFPADEAAMIVSTRIRVGRNLADYPLGPGITNEQRKEVLQRVTKAFESYTGDLAGNFYALTDLTSAQRKQLIEDHFLFK